MNIVEAIIFTVALAVLCVTSVSQALTIWHLRNRVERLERGDA